MSNDDDDEYTRFKNSSTVNRQLLLKERLILEITEAICREMERQNLSSSVLASLVGIQEKPMIQILSGLPYLSFGFIARIADALNCEIKFELVPKSNEV